MKTKKAHLISSFIVLAIGIVFGGLFQKFYGFGFILEAFGIKYQAKPIPQVTQTINESNILVEYQGKMQLFILAGQSNMSGRGDVPQSQTINSRIYVFGNDYRWKLAIEPIDDPLNQVDEISEDSPPGYSPVTSAGYSPATSFASAVLERNPDMVIGLIPCAMGGTKIFEWKRSLSDSTLYGSCLKRAKAASVMGNISGLLFFQGESDTVNTVEAEIPVVPNQWADDFIEFVGNWRIDLELPELPVVFAQIGANINPDLYPNWAIIQEQQRSVQLPFCEMIITDDLKINNDRHFSTEGYQIIGKRFAEAYLKVKSDLGKSLE